ncbi:MAG: hypothetical protein Q4C42_08945, partial [Clostridia bacterium]|nr:hypothetical protein [Clostridia bacterium]
ATEAGSKQLANIVKLKYDTTTKKYSATLTDSKAILANWMNDIGTVSGLTLTRSGSKLTISASQFSGTKTISASKSNMVDEDSVTVWTVNNALYQNFALNGAPASASAYLTVQCSMENKAISVRKTSDDGNISGVTFKLVFNNADYVKAISGVESGVTKTTDSTGKISFGSSFPVYNAAGDRIIYRITEIENQSLYTGLSVDTSSETGFIEKGTTNGINPYVRFYLANDSGTMANFVADFENHTHKANVSVQKTSEDDVKAGFKFTLTPST